MRTEIWNLRARIHFNLHYWGLFSSRIKKWEIGIKLILGLGTVGSLIAFASFPSLAVAASIVSFVCALAACVILPAICWDTLSGRVENVYHRWVDSRRIIDALWSEAQSDKKVSKKSLNAVRGIVDEVSKNSFWFSDSKKLQKKAGEMRDISILS